jgi:NADH-quinone oxidoreductase subunit H
MWSFENISQSVDTWLYDTFSPTTAMLIEFLIIAICVIGLFAISVGSDPDGKKSSAWMQVRLGLIASGRGECFRLLRTH